MRKAKDYRRKTKNFFSKLYTRFTNYRNTKKWFVLYLAVLAFFLFCFPIVEVKYKTGNEGVWFLFSGMLWKSSLVILIAMAGLFLWNLSITFKGWITKLCALREDEPLVDFVLLWIIVSVFMGLIDGANIGIATETTQSVKLINKWVLVDGLLLLGGLVWSFISLRKMSQKSNKRTRIVNIVEENHQKSEPQRSNQVTHLFDDLDKEN